MTETLLSIVMLATPSESSVQSLLTKSLEHSSIHYFCFCSVLPNFFINALDLTTNDEYSGRVELSGKLQCDVAREIYAFEFLLILRV